MNNIPNDILEAYRGHYEGESEEYVRKVLKSHGPRDVLEVYLTWNGIIGYTNRIFEIATKGANA